MGRCIVLLQDPQFVFPHLRPFLTNPRSQLCQIFQIVSLVCSLTLWNPFSHHNAIMKKLIGMTLNFNFSILTFFILGNARVFQSMDCHMVSTSYWNIHVSSQVMIFSISSDSLPNLSRKSEQIC